jgi:hypothetical protein
VRGQIWARHDLPGRLIYLGPQSHHQAGRNATPDPTLRVKLYDRTNDQITLDEIERIAI